MATKKKATITRFDIQSGTDNTVYATWSWGEDHTDHYEVRWYYGTGDGVWFLGTETSVTVKQATYTPPSQALRVRFRVLPVATTHKVNKKDTVYWTAQWSDQKTISVVVKDPPPEIGVPPVPDVEVEGYTLHIRIENVGDIHADSIKFYVLRNDTEQYASAQVKIERSFAGWDLPIDAGATYKVRCRAFRGDEYGDLSDFSSVVSTRPNTPGGITVCRAKSDTSVELQWKEAIGATSYDIEYTDDITLFDRSNSTTVINDITGTQFFVTGLESGDEYFFRVRAVNDEGESGWTTVKSCIIGKTPDAPTTWSSTTTAMLGEIVTLYWVHNSEDNSRQTKATIELIINGLRSEKEITTPQEEDEEEQTYFYEINTGDLQAPSVNEGSVIQWRVKTAGITNVYGDWSIQRTIKVYAPPTLQISLTQNGASVDTVTSFPFYLNAQAGPTSQTPTGYHISVTANETYTTINQIGQEETVRSGDEIFSAYVDSASPTMQAVFSANNIDLENSIHYTVTCTVAMSSGLTATNSLDFSVSWDETIDDPDLAIGYDPETLTTYLGPYCEDDSGNRPSNIRLSVYRREFNGTFVLIAENMENANSVYCTDPHPALDYARYRVVATDQNTGAVSFYDPPGYPIGEGAVIIQWDEAWSTFDTGGNEDELEEPPWSGSMLKLPYNIEVSDSNSADISFVEYIGRSYPVSYYGTQIGAKSTWSVAIPKDDTETLYQIRRLAAWMGDVYVREPSGSGYWASISVSFNQKYSDLTIPITFDITRVEGGA